MTVLGEEDFALAGEYVLGLLGPAEQALTEARIATDTEFAAEVSAWQVRLQPIIEGDDVAPSPSVWSAIVRALPQPTGQDVGRGGLRIWQAIAGASTLAAAILGVLLLQQPAPVALPLPVPPLIAALGSETGSASITARYDATNGQMLLTPVSLDTGNLYPELWIIPADGKPRSLGVVRGDGPSQIVISAGLRELVDPGATLAVTPELQTGSPTGQPSGPIIASGKIVSI